MCLPFCCRENDPPQPQVRHEHHTGHGVEHVDHPPSSGTGKGSNNGNGANMNKNKGDEDKNNMANSPPTPAPESPEYSDTEDEEVPSPTPAAPQTPPSPPKHRDQKTEEASVAARTPVPTAATKLAPKKLEQVVASPRHHAGPAVAAAGVADSARTPPETQVARRGQAHENDYGYPKPSASPTVVAVPAANNVRGDRGYGDGAHAHAYVGKDDRKTPGRTSRQ